MTGRLLLLLSASALVWGHVPAYGTECRGGCCPPVRDHAVSQTVYFLGSGALLLPIDDGVTASGTLHVDVLLRDPVPSTAYDVHVGCGVCGAPRSGSRARTTDANPVRLEPFTQTAYRSVLVDRTVDAASLSAAACPDGALFVGLVQTDDEAGEGADVVWAAVLGKEEAFTALELLSFPVYILRNHGDAWNELPWTYWALLLVAAPLLVGTVAAIARGGRPAPTRAAAPVLYDLAVVAFVAAGLEEGVHLYLAQSRAEAAGGELWIALLLVIGAAQGGGVVAALLLARCQGGAGGRAGRLAVHLAVGGGLLFLLGSGFYLGPVLLVAAGMAPPPCRRPQLGEEGLAMEAPAAPSPPPHCVDLFPSPCDDLPPDPSPPFCEPPPRRPVRKKKEAAGGYFGRV